MTNQLAAAMVTLMLLVTACGNSGTSRGISAAAAQTLQRDVDALKADVSVGDQPAAQRDLFTLLRDVDISRARSLMTKAAADRVVSSTQGVYQTLHLLSAPVSATTTSSSTTLPAPTTPSTARPPGAPGDKHHGRGQGDG